MRQTVDEMLHHQAQITANLKLWVVDKDIPLDERWDVFIKSGLGDTSDWSLDLDSLPDEAVCYDGLIHCDRHQTVDMERVMETLEDQANAVKEGNSYANKDAHLLDIPKIKEEILKEFIWSFTYDW